MSGLFANKILKNKVDSDLQEIDKDLQDIKSVIDTSALDIKNLMLQQTFLDNFEEENCRFLDIYTDHLYSQISSYWQVLPQRLEEHDKETRQTNEYIAIKREYIRLSLRFWLTAQKSHRECNNNEMIPILYFYSKDCENCVEQGVNFDMFSLEMQKQNKTILIFPIDGEFPEDTVFLLKRYYNISKYPTVIIDKNVIHGKVIDSKGLEMLS